MEKMGFMLRDFCFVKLPKNLQKYKNLQITIKNYFRQGKVVKYLQVTKIFPEESVHD